MVKSKLLKNSTKASVFKGPSSQTLKRYGLTREEWMKMYDRYDGCCHICRKPSKRLCVDHFHMKGWASMEPEERKKYVRGLLCWTCNAHLLSRGITIQKLKNAIQYLEDWENKK